MRISRLVRFAEKALHDTRGVSSFILTPPRLTAVGVMSEVLLWLVWSLFWGAVIIKRVDASNSIPEVHSLLSNKRGTRQNFHKYQGFKIAAPKRGLALCPWKLDALSLVAFAARFSPNAWSRWLDRNREDDMQLRILDSG
jgi:hypothetical protein